MGTVWQPRLVYDVQQLSSAPAAADKLPLNGLSLSKAIQREHTSERSVGVASGCKTLASFFFTVELCRLLPPLAQWIGFERSARPRETAELLLAPASGGETPRGEPSHAKAMATWYGAHIAQAANSEGGPDGEALVLELWELLALRGSDVGRLGAVATRLLGMPWHQHLREPLEAQRAPEAAKGEAGRQQGRLAERELQVRREGADAVARAQAGARQEARAELVKVREAHAAELLGMRESLKEARAQARALGGEAKRCERLRGQLKEAQQRAAAAAEGAKELQVRLLGEEERAAGLEQRLRRSKAEANFAGAIGSVCMSTIVAAGTALALWPSHGSSC